MRYRRRPPLIEAMQLVGGNESEVCAWVNDHGGIAAETSTGIVISTGSDFSGVCDGDYVVREEGRFRSYTSGEFAAIFEEILDTGH